MDKTNKVKSFIDLLSRAMARKGINGSALAQEIGVPRATVYSWLSGRNVMSLEKYYRVLSALNMTEALNEE